MWETVAVWVEALALVAIFGLDFWEYRKQGKDRIEQHKETLAQMEVMQRYALAAEAAANAANTSSETAKATLAQMQDAAERQLRAYICVDSATLKFPEANVPEAQIHLRNCGQTPAYDVSGWIHTWFAEYPLKEVLPSAPDDLRKGIEPLASGRISIFVAPRKPPLPPENLARLGTAQFTMYVYGEIRYKDIFGKERFTKYRLVHGGNEGVRKVSGKDGSDHWLLKPDLGGNEAS
jgi:hypothetical protein